MKIIYEPYTHILGVDGGLVVKRKYFTNFKGLI